MGNICFVVYATIIYIFSYMLDQNLSIIFWTFWTGKTYYAVRNAYQAYQNGAVVISNMWLAFPHIRWYLPSDLPSILHEIYDYHENVIVPFEAPDSFLASHGIKRNREDSPRNFYVLADEWGVFFNSRNFQQNFKEKSLLVMLAEPRHFNMQITAITQKLDLIDKTFRDLSQEIIEFTPFFFWIFRRSISYDLKYLKEEWWWNEESQIIETKTYFHWWQRKKDTSNFLGWLYFTKEVLGDLALRRPDDIKSLKEFFEREDTEHDWRDSMVNKILTRATELDISEKVIKSSQKLRKVFDKIQEKRNQEIDEIESSDPVFSLETNVPENSPDDSDTLPRSGRVLSGEYGGEAKASGASPTRKYSDFLAKSSERV